MKISALAGAIVTPIKGRDVVSSSSTTIDNASGLLEKRFTPSKSAVDLISKMQRCHLFVQHNACFSDLRSMHLTPMLSSQMSSILLEESPDIPDFLMKMEEDALISGDFNSFLRTFLSEQLNISLDLSFSALILFNYSHRFGVSLEDAYKEVFELFSTKTICEKCDRKNNFLWKFW